MCFLVGVISRFSRLCNEVTLCDIDFIYIIDGFFFNYLFLLPIIVDSHNKVVQEGGFNQICVKDFIVHCTVLFCSLAQCSVHDNRIVFKLG